MLRCALIVSLALHGGLLFMVGWGWSSNAARIVPWRTGTDASPLPKTFAVSLVVVTEPPSMSSLDETPFNDSEFVQVKPAIVPAIPAANIIPAIPPQLPVLVASIPSTIPVTEPFPSTPTRGKAGRRGHARSGDRSGERRDSGAGGGENGSRVAGYVPPRFLLRNKPLYPMNARAQHLEGTVLLLVSVDAAGHVTSTNVLRSCGHEILDRAALAAVRSWRFDPARQDGAAIAARVEVPVRFRFEERSPAGS